MKVVLSFSGSVVLNDDTLMQSIVDCQPIKLSDWLKLPEQEKDNYILDNAVEAIKNGTDDEWEQLDLSTQEEI